ncbi:hypothetical protein F511_25685 [Dorcoceras hygrometricum]|uniref:Uncharacterized protein n=1 Tax=Dorcoceras hygrometricum TaxID=472368 RepID=A0A2Z7CNA5_9LAMI|nr:hypothetical protein F511_25685 [Dorcoceras hygrometricum]
MSTRPDTSSKTAPADSSSQLDLDSCLTENKKKQRGTKRKKRVESSDSESNISLPITHLVWRRRTQRPQTQQRSTGERDDPQHGSLPAVPVEGVGISAKENIATGSKERERANREQNSQMSGDFQNEENQGYETLMDPVNPNESDGAQNESERSTVNSLEKETENTERAIIIRSDKGKGMLDVISKLNPVVENCQFVLKSAWNNISAKIDIFDEWTHFRREVRLKGISSFDHLSQIEEQLLEWGETEKISELFERSSLIIYKLYELEVEKLYNEHLANFKLDGPSVNHDYLCIRRLDKDLKEIATLHRAQLALADLPIMAPEASFAGLVFNQPPILALSFSSQSEQEQAVDQASIQLTALDDEHQAHREHDYLDAQQEQQGSGGNPTPIEDPSVHIVDIVNNPGTHSFLDEHGTDHQDQSPSNLCIVTYTLDSEEDTRLSFLESFKSSHTGSQRMFISSPPDSPQANSKLDEVYKVVASIDSRMLYMESKMTSVDSRTLSLDSNMQPMEFKIRSMNSHIKQLVDTQNILKLDFRRHKGIIYEKVETLASTIKSSQTALETSLIRQLAGQQQHFTDDLDMVKLQLAELVEHLKKIAPKSGSTCATRLPLSCLTCIGKTSELRGSTSKTEDNKIT